MSNLKHEYTFTYQVTESNVEGVTPRIITFKLPGDASLNDMLAQFEHFLKACGYELEGMVDVVERN